MENNTTLKMTALLVRTMSLNVTAEANTSTLKLVNCLIKKEYRFDKNGGTGSSADSTNTNVTVNGDKNAFYGTTDKDIELVDEMGSALDYYMNSLTINGNKATANQVSYDETKTCIKK